MLLIVEDDNSISDFISMVGTDYFKEIKSANNLEEAYKILNSTEQLELSIIDLNLKEGEKGTNIIRSILSNDHFKSSPIIVMSDLFDATFVKNNQGRFDLLEKPFTLGSLKILLKKYAPKLKNEKDKVNEEKDLKSSAFLKSLMKG